MVVVWHYFCMVYLGIYNLRYVREWCTCQTVEFSQSRLNEDNELHYILLYLFSTFDEIVSRLNEEDISMYSARGGTVGVSLGHAECMASSLLCSNWVNV